MNNSKNEQLKELYKSSIRASYFAGFSDKNAIQKSKVQLKAIDE